MLLRQNTIRLQVRLLIIIQQKQVHLEYPSFSPWAQCSLVSTTHPINDLPSVLDCARMLTECTSIQHHSLVSPSHSLLDLPRTPVPSVMPNTTCFNSGVLSIRQMCPEKLFPLYHRLDYAALAFLSSHFLVCYILLPSDMQDTYVTSHLKCHQLLLVLFPNVQEDGRIEGC
jgi:hypothetical protein